VLAACAGCSVHPAINANATHGVYLSERFNKGFQFAHVTPAGDFVLETVTILPCLDPRAEVPGYRYVHEQGELRPLGDVYSVATDQKSKLVVDITDERIVMRDNEGSVTLHHIKDAQFTARTTAYRRAVVDNPEAVCPS
jgi:hypothetical protein